jgi:hypothetical protein
MVLEVVSEFISRLIIIYSIFVSTLPAPLDTFVNLFLLVVLIVAYSIIIWYTYRFIARKDIIGLNLNQYNRFEHAFLVKTLASFFFIIEYIIILPLLIFFWFALFGFLLSLIVESSDVNLILKLSAVVVASVRMAAYFKEDLAQEIAKLMPFNILAFSLISLNFLSTERLGERLAQIPDFYLVAQFLLFIIFLEFLLRMFDFIFTLFGLQKPGEEKIVD